MIFARCTQSTNNGTKRGKARGVYMDQNFWPCKLQGRGGVGPFISLPHY